MTFAAINQICSASFNGKLPPAKEKGVGHLAVSSLGGMEEEMRANKGGLALSPPLSLSHSLPRWHQW